MYIEEVSDSVKREIILVYIVVCAKTHFVDKILKGKKNVNYCYFIVPL